MNVEITQSLMGVAQGLEKADMVITGGKVFNVFTGELLDNCSVSIKGKRIAYVGGHMDEVIGNNTVVIDAGGKTLIPGLIDGHTHIAWMNTPEEFLKLSMDGGTTTIITEIMEPYPVAGLAGILDFLDSLQDQPIKIYATAPAMVSISRRTRAIDMQDLKVLLARPDILGLGESYWQGVLQSPDVYLPVFAQTLAFRKTLEGHTAGASEKKLNAYVAAGISSCHEPIQAQEALDRLRLGLHVMIREGSVRRELDAISKITGTGADLRRLVLVSDGISPEVLMEKGYMEYIVQKAINRGFSPMDAIRMATLNVAEHFSIDHHIGAIAPGRYADILIIPDIDVIKPEYVISSGKIIAKNGTCLVQPRSHAFSAQSRNTVCLPKSFAPDDFVIQAADGRLTLTVRVIGLVTDLVTREIQIRLPATDGEIRANPSQDILKIAAIDRAKNPGEMFVGLIRGFGLASGAIASSSTWDSADIIVIGANDADMAHAVNRIRELQGGTVISNGQRVVAELPLPIFGVISDEPMGALIRQARQITIALEKMGVKLPDPMLTLATLTSAAIPFFRICEEGLVYLKDGTTVGLMVDE